MRGLKSHFVFNRSQRNGIFLLLLLIIILQAGYFFIDFSSEASVSPEQQEKITRFQKQIDSLKRQKALKDSTEVFPFNPNYISDFKGYTLGMSLEEIDRLYEYRAQNKWINSSEDFQKVTEVSDSLLNKISSLFIFPEWAQRPAARKPESQGTSLPIKKSDLNTVTAEDLRRVNGVGEVLSKRIINYRESLGGFNHEIQLYDVYGLSPEVVERLNIQFSVFQPVQEEQDLNSISLIALSELPYFNYELARRVISYRDNNGKINSFEELVDLKGFPRDKLERIKLYLSID